MLGHETNSGPRGLQPRRPSAELNDPTRVNDSPEAAPQPPLSGALPAREPLRPRELTAAIATDLVDVGIRPPALLFESLRGCGAESARWCGLYALTVLALEATLTHSPQAFGFIGLFCGCFLLADHLDGTGKTAVDTIGRGYLRRLKERLLDTLGRSTLRSLRDDDNRSELEHHYERAGSIAGLIGHTVSLPGYATKLALSAGALLSVDWRLGTLVTLAVVPGFFLKARHVVADVDLEHRQRAHAQIGDRIETEVYRTDGAIRAVLGGLTRSLGQSLSYLQAALDAERDSHERRQNAQLLGAYIGYYGAMFGGMAMLIGQYNAGALAIGTFAFLCLQLKDIAEEVSNHGETYHQFKRVWEEARRFYSFVRPTADQGDLSFPPESHLRGDSVVISRGTFELSIPTLDIPPGSLVVIHGGSGTGKTTLLEHLAFAARPQRGSLTVGGVPIDGIRFSEWRRHIAYCGARVALLEGRTIREILQAGDETDENVTGRAAHPLIAGLIADLNRQGGLDTRVGEGLLGGRGLSTGEQHRLLLVAAVVPRPAILFLDEVTSNQSDDFVAGVGALLDEYRAAGSTILFATHSKRFDARASHLIRVSGGVAEMLSPPAHPQPAG